MAIRFSIVDAFTEEPFRGNPAAVCFLPGPATPAWMQSVAAEFNLPMTAFVIPHHSGDAELRWFTPTVEVEICGHATLATGHVLGGANTFRSKSGTLRSRLTDDRFVELDFPAIPVHPVEDPLPIERAVGLAPGSVIGAWAGDVWWLAEVSTREEVEKAQPDLGLLQEFGGVLIVAAQTRGRSGVDSACRVFEPASGLNEDPVTGSAHCVIAPWLAARTGRTEFVGEQLSARRGTVRSEVRGDRVLLRGRAVTVAEGTLVIDPD